MTKTNKTETVTCGKCGGNGRYYFSGGASGVCFPCEGTGRVEALPPCPSRPERKLTAEQATLRLRGWYRNARRGELTLEDVLDPNFAGWTLAGVNEALDLVPGSRAAFRDLGWPV